MLCHIKGVQVLTPLLWSQYCAFVGSYWGHGEFIIFHDDIKFDLDLYMMCQCMFLMGHG